MNFIEQLFRVSPDNGNGMLEATIFIVVFVVPTVLVVLRIRRPRLR
jgi:hypothetical protein